MVVTFALFVTSSVLANGFGGAGKVSKLLEADHFSDAEGILDQVCGDNHRPIRLSRRKGGEKLGHFEIGVTAGTSHSFTDIQDNKYLGFGETLKNFTSELEYNVGVYFNYRHVSYFGLGVGFNLISLSGVAISPDTSQIGTNDPSAGYSFNNQIFEFNGRLLFYAPLSSLRFFDLFAFVGLSTYYNNLELRDMNNLVTFPPAEYSNLQMAIPFGLGFSVRIGSSFSLGFESGYRYTPFNYLDGMDPSNTRYDAFLLNQFKLGFFLN